jgi:xanthine dehydrogenase accessory factor
MRGSTLDAILAARAAKTPMAVITRLEDGAEALVWRDSVGGALELSGTAVQEARTRVRDDKSGTIEDGALFVHVYNPPLRLIVVGAVHISQALAPMARVCGFDVTVIDPRGSFATDERFPDVKLIDEWPDDAMETLAPDSRTAVVTLTHDPKLDDPALEVALKSEAFYIACLGSRRTHAKRLERLTDLGFDAETLGRIHGPAGLPLGATSPAEIALSVMAEMTAIKHGRAPALAAA